MLQFTHGLSNAIVQQTHNIPTFWWNLLVLAGLIDLYYSGLQYISRHKCVDLVKQVHRKLCHEIGINKYLGVVETLVLEPVIWSKWTFFQLQISLKCSAIVIFVTVKSTGTKIRVIVLVEVLQFFGPVVFKIYEYLELVLYRVLFGVASTIGLSVDH